MKESFARRVLTGITAAALLLPAGCVNHQQSRTQDVDGISVYDIESRPDAPAIAGRTLDGRSIGSDDFSGSVVVLNFWASWCAPCRLETPHLLDAARETEGKNVIFLGVNVQDTTDKAIAFTSAYDVPYSNIVDPGGRIAMSFSGNAPRTIPATVVLDANGRIASVINGPIDRDALLAVLEHVIEEIPRP